MVIYEFFGWSGHKKAAAQINFNEEGQVVYVREASASSAE